MESNTATTPATDLFTEDIMELARAAFALADSTGRKPCIASLRRWAQRGCRGHRLETVFLGNRMMTSRQAVARFLAAINGGAVAPHEMDETTAAQKAGEKLDAMLN